MVDMDRLEMQIRVGEVEFRRTIAVPAGISMDEVHRAADAWAEWAGVVVFDYRCGEEDMVRREFRLVEELTEEQIEDLWARLAEMLGGVLVEG